VLRHIEVCEVLASHHGREQKLHGNRSHHLGRIIDRDHLLLLDFGHYLVRQEQELVHDLRAGKLVELLHVLFAEVRRPELLVDRVEDFLANALANGFGRPDIVVGHR
jgi:hypothetical protein